MRKTLASFSHLLPVLLVAQSPDVVTLRDGSSNVVNGTTVLKYGTPTEVSLEQALTVELNGLVPRTVNVRRYELSVVTGSKNYFGWGQNMLLPTLSGSLPAWEAYDPLPMEAQDVADFSAYFRPEGASANCCFQFVWYDVDNPNDSSWVNICFDTETFTGLEEQGGVQPSLVAYPNPVTGGEVTFTFDVTGDMGGLQLVLYNALGQRSKVHSLSVAKGLATISIMGLPAGVWSASLERNGRTVTTRRLVVGH